MEVEENVRVPMPSPYSYDLRRKALDAVKNGERKIAVCRMLRISRNTLDLWLKREEHSGECRAITGFQSGNRHKITDWNSFRQFAREHGGKTQAQMAKLWGDNVTQQDISRALTKLALSRKTKHTVTGNAMNSSARSSKHV